MPKVPLIAIVDDDIAMRKALGELLHSAGLESKAFASALDFLADYRSGTIDVVITDLKMPKMDGVELLRRLIAVGSAPPVIIVTSSTGAVTRARAIESGAVACLTKPVAPTVLLDLIHGVLARRPGPFPSGRAT